MGSRQVPATWQASSGWQTTGLPPTQAPAWQVSVCVQILPSMQLVPSGTFGVLQIPDVGSQLPGAWHCAGVGQVTGLVPVHTPDWQLSVCVHAFPSLHVVPLFAFGFEQTPVAGAQLPATWHWSLGVHTFGFPPVHTPAWQVSVCVQALPSLHDVPLFAFGFEQTPVDGAQVPATWHWSLGVQTFGFAPVHIPDWQVSVCVQALPSLHVVPFDFGAQVPTEPVRLQAEHWSVQAVLQQTPLAQNPVAHWLLLVQPRPDDAS
jgi:hypothetical protein